MPGIYDSLMRKCINLAKKSQGRVSPNPLTGAIVFDDDFRIISQGRHEKYGENHAERNAILNSKEDVRGKNLIVNLEPCSHYGKTPPCCDLIIKSGIKKVIIGTQDPNPIVNGKGIKKLRDANIEVITGVLEDECMELNEIFFKNQIENKPFVAIKTAMTLDSKIATKTLSSKWITDEVSRREVQKLRNKYDAVLTSSSTVIADNPSMTCRLKNGRNPVRIIFDTELKTDPLSKIYEDNGVKVIILSGKDDNGKYGQNVEIIKCPVKNSLADIGFAVNILYENGIKSILVEAGGFLNNSFVQSGIADKLYCFIAPKLLCDNDGKSFVYGQKRFQIAECNNLNISSLKKLNNDIMIIGNFVKNENYE